MDEPNQNTQPNIQTPPAAPAPLPAPATGPQGQFNRPPRRGGGFGGFGGGRGRGGPGGGRGGRGGRTGRPMEKPEYEQKTLDIARVARVTKGGKRFSFRTTVVIGDGKGKVAVGMAKGKDVAQSIQKAYNQAKKNLFSVLIVNGTIPYQVEAKFHSAVVILKPSKSGIKAGGAVRVVAQLAGIRSLTGKLVERTNNKLNIAMATVKALRMLRSRTAAPKPAAEAQSQPAPEPAAQ